MQLPHFGEITGWDVFGLMGNVAFTSRFVVQWICSERAGRTVMPMAFWYLSLIGASISLTYFIGERNLPGTLGYCFSLVPYIRNIMLTQRHRKQVLYGEKGLLPDKAPGCQPPDA